MSIQPMEPAQIRIPETRVEPEFVCYSDSACHWAILCRVLQRFDCETIENDLERAFFVAWREKIKCAVIAALAISWLDEISRQNFQKDLLEHLGG